LVYPLNSNASLEYKLYCKFTSDIVITPAIEAANFSYYVENSNFTISKQVYWTLRYKLWNFNVLSDDGGSQYFRLTQEQLAGIDSIWFNTSLYNIPDQYWHGNRLYAEISWTLSIPPVQSKFLKRLFLDSPEKKVNYSSTLSNSKTLDIVLGLMIPLIVIALVIFIFRRRILQRIGYGYLLE